MLTIFSAPKAFTDPHIRIIQRNGIRRWLAITPRPEIILLGNDNGVAEVAMEFDLRHHSQVACNEYGTPLVSDMFRQAELATQSPILCLVNADIILPGHMMKEVQRIPFQWFLAVGQRWNADIIEEVDFADSKWGAGLRAWLMRNAKLQSVVAIDYFVFSRGLFGHIPDFAVGRPAFDNWLIFRALVQGAALVDVTQVVPIVHQNHGYAHVAGGDGRTWNGPEADRNRSLAGEHLFDILDCRYLVGADGIRVARDRQHVERRVERLATLRPMLFRTLLSWKLRYLFCWLFPAL